MPAQRRPGMDHEHYEWSPISERPRLVWPDGKTLALCVVVSLEHMEWEPPEGSFQAHNLAGGLGRRPRIDYARLTHREYGHRVGIFRVLDTLEKHGVPVNIAMDVLTAEHYPWLAAHCRERGARFIGHGHSVSRMVTGKMSEDEERQYIESALDRLGKVGGVRPTGWFGPEYGESVRTPRLLAEAGVRYVLDWVNDEQPYRMTTPSGELFALPMHLEMDDVHALWDRNVTPDRYRALLVEAGTTLAHDGAANARTLVVHLHPWLIGQPFRIGMLDRALQELLAIPSVVAASADDIVEWAAGQR